MLKDHSGQYPDEFHIYHHGGQARMSQAVVLRFQDSYTPQGSVDTSNQAFELRYPPCQVKGESGAAFGTI